MKSEFLIILLALLVINGCSTGGSTSLDSTTFPTLAATTPPPTIIAAASKEPTLAPPVTVEPTLTVEPSETPFSGNPSYEGLSPDGDRSVTALYGIGDRAPRVIVKHLADDTTWTLVYDPDALGYTSSWQPEFGVEGWNVARGEIYISMRVSNWPKDIYWPPYPLNQLWYSLICLKLKDGTWTTLYGGPDVHRQLGMHTGGVSGDGNWVLAFEWGTQPDGTATLVNIAQGESFSVERPEGFDVMGDVVWSPDNQHALYTTRRFDGSESALWRFDRDSTRSVRIPTSGNGPMVIDWLESKRATIAYNGDCTKRWSLNPETGEETYLGEGLGGCPSR